MCLLLGSIIQIIFDLMGFAIVIKQGLYLQALRLNLIFVCIQGLPETSSNSLKHDEGRPS